MATSHGGGRLLALLGLVPLGAFVAVHLVTTATAVSGAARFDHVFARGRALTTATLLVVMVPLLAHATWGIWVMTRTAHPVALPGWRPRLRRWAAVVTLLFIAGHVAELSLPRWMGRLPASALYEVTEAHLSSTWHSLPLVALAYLAGTAATLFHLGTSGWATFRGSRVVLSERTEAGLKWAVVLGVAGLMVLATNTIVYMATGSRLVGREPTFVPDGPPPAACTPKS
jgi:succinate dehydrogenase / fumarate reductase cytochrome b subunit